MQPKAYPTVSEVHSPPDQACAFKKLSNTPTIKEDQKTSPNCFEGVGISGIGVLSISKRWNYVRD